MNRIHITIPALALVLLLAVCASTVSSMSAKTNQATVGTAAIDPGRRMTVKKGTVENKVIAPGKLIAKASATVVFSVSSQVLSITVKEGDLVKAGQPLIILDTTDLVLAAQQAHLNFLGAVVAYSQTLKGPSPIAVKAAKASLASAQASYSDLQRAPSPNDTGGLKAALANTEAAVRNAQSNYDKAFRENPAGISGSSEGLALEQATNNYVAAKTAYERAFEKAKPGVLANMASQIAAAQANLDALTTVVTETILQAKVKADSAYLVLQQAEQMLQKTTVVAPIDGMVMTIAFRKGDTVTAGARALDIADFASPLFEASVDEADVGGVRVGQETQFSVQAYPDQVFTAKVRAVAPTGVVASNVVTFKALLTMPSAMGARPGEGVALLPGMSGKAELIVGSAQDVIVIPTSLMARDPDSGEYSVQRLLAGDKF